MDGAQRWCSIFESHPPYEHRRRRRERQITSLTRFRTVAGARGEWRVDCLTDAMAVTIYGVCAVTFMMVMYALEGRGRGFVLGFAFGCVLSSIYGFLSGAWPFGVVELIWAGVALRRYRQRLATA
jgi:hypothetical protein